MPNSDTAWKQPPPHPEGSEKGIQKRLFPFFKSYNLFSPEDCKQTLKDLTEETKPCRKYAKGILIQMWCSREGIPELSNCIALFYVYQLEDTEKDFLRLCHKYLGQ
jgi:hypothetical protein